MTVKQKTCIVKFLRAGKITREVKERRLSTEYSTRVYNIIGLPRRWKSFE